MTTWSRSLPLIPILLTACAGTPPERPTSHPTTPQPASSGPEAVIPVFSADDPRVDTAGFVAETLRLDVEHDGVRYTLMAYVVGDTLTLGAMVKGTFEGVVRWKVGRRQLELPFDTTGSLRDVPVSVDGTDTGLRGEGASFRGITWVNVDLPRADWIANGTALQLEFAPEQGAPWFLPAEGARYRVRLKAS